MTNPQHQPRAPHMVMAVGNHVVGDSRVEKAATSARDHGYRVTVLGVKHRSVPALGFIDYDIPVLRLPVRNEHHSRGTRRAVSKANAMSELEFGRRLDQRLQNIAARGNSVRSRARSGERSPYIKFQDVVATGAGVTGAAVGRGLDRLDAGTRRLSNLMLRAQALSPEGWRNLWPQLNDFEEVFASGFEFLHPDLIHVHDRHPMPGAVAYARKRRDEGAPVDWIYDAHEWLPGQRIPGPASQKVGWLEAERDLIRDARLVLTVSDSLAEALKRRHALTEMPTVVANAPMLAGTKGGAAVRSIRSDAGVSPDERLVVYVGAITERRGVLDLVDACSVASEMFHVAFVAPIDPRSRAMIRERARDKGIIDRVHILDYVASNTLVSYIESADAGISPLLPSAAHHLAVPTKVREYVQAQIPVVVSDMRAQEQFVTEQGIGEVSRAGDARDLARAIVTVLESPDNYRRHLTVELLRDNSWDVSASLLLDSWGQLAEPAARIQTRADAAADLAVNANANGILRKFFLQGEGSLSSRVICKALQQIPEEYFSQVSVDPNDQGAGDVWKRWCDDYGGVRARVTDDLEPNDFDDQAYTSLLRRAGVSSLRFVGERALDDVDVLLDAYPHHWLHELSADRLARRARTSRRARERLLSSGNIIISPFEQIAAVLGSRASAVPIPLPYTGSRFHEKKFWKKVRVGVLASPRTRAEKEALGRLEALGRRVQIEDVGADSALSGFDIVIDSLSEDSLSVQGWCALACGALVVAGKRTEASRVLVAENPAINTAPDELVDSVATLIADPSAFSCKREESADRIRRNHCSEAVNAAIEVALL